jgi:putative ABC transport system permease protein
MTGWGILLLLLAYLWAHLQEIAIVVGVGLVLVWAVLWLLIGRVPLKYNLRNLMVRWRITLLTALAFTLVIGLMTVMLAFVNGMYRLTAGSGHPGNVIVLADGALDELFSSLGYSDISDVERQPGVLHDDRDVPLCSKEVYVVVNQPIPGAQKGDRQRRFTQVRGLEDPQITGKVHNMRLHPGGAWFSAAGVLTAETPAGPQPAIQAVLGEGIARELGHDMGKPLLEVGDVFALGPRWWIAVGILQSAGSTFDSEIWAKRQLVGPLFGKENFSTLVLRTADADRARELKEEVTTRFKKAALQAQLETDYYEKLNGTNAQFLGVIIFVTAIMAIGGMFGVMNTMFAAVNSRIKDIGVLRILGFSGPQILLSFFFETLMIAIIGGAIGLALGSLCHGWTASSIASSGQGGGGKSVVLKLIIDSTILTNGFLFSLIMGALGGLLPAVAAMRMKPLESLR